MRNTLALGIILLGSVLILSAFKNWKLLTTIQVILGMKPWSYHADGGGRSMSGTIAGTPTPGAANTTNPNAGSMSVPPGHTWSKKGQNAKLQPSDYDSKGRYENIQNTDGDTGVVSKQTQFTFTNIDDSPGERHYYSEPELSQNSNFSGTRAQSGVAAGF